MRNAKHEQQASIVVLLMIERPVTMALSFVIFGEIILVTSVVMSGVASVRFRDDDKNGVDNLHDTDKEPG